MANEISFSFSAGKTCYALVRTNNSGTIWNTNTNGFEAYLTANYSKYAIALTEQGAASAFFAGNMPGAIPAGTYAGIGKQQIGGTPAESDPTVAGGNIEWNGLNIVPLSDLSTSGQLGVFGPIKIARGTMIKPFSFYLKSAADHVTPLLSGICSGQISRDGGAFTALQSGAFSEIGQGFYQVQALTSGDLLANNVALLFSANAVSGGLSDPCPMALVLQRVSGQ